VELLLRDEKYLRGLLRAQAKLMRFSAAVTQTGKKMMAMGTGMVAPILAAATSFASMGDALAKTSARLGVSVEALSGLGYAAERGKIGVNTLHMALQRMTRRVAEAARDTGEAKAAIKELGFDAQKLARMTPDAMLKVFADALQRVGSQSDRVRLAFKLFDSEGVALLQMMQDGSRGISEMQEEAKRLGIVMSTEDAQAAAEFTDTMTRLWNVIRRVSFEVGRAAADVLEKYADKLRTILQTVSAWIREHGQVIATTLKWGTVLMAAGAALWAVGKALAIVTVAMKGLVVAMALVTAHPLVLLLTSAAAAVILLTGALDAATEETNSLADAMEKLSSADATKARRLEELSKKQRLSSEEMIEAQSLIESLESTYGDLGLAVNKATKEIEGMAEAQAKLNRQIVGAGMATGAIMGFFGGQPEVYREEQGALGTGRSEAAERFEESMVQRLRDLRIAAIEDEHKRALAAINERYDQEIQRAVEAGATIEGVEEARSQAIANAQATRDRRRAEEQKRQAEEQQRLDEERADRQADLQYDIARLQIEASKKGLDKRLALINLEERRAIEAAKETGLAIADVQRKYDLQRQAARIAADTPQDPRISARGTFNPWAVRGMGTGRPEERTAKAVEEMKAKMGQLIEVNENQLRAFQRGMLVA
jgi:hypothetical protein